MTIYKSHKIFLLTVILLLSGANAGATEKRWKVVKDTLATKEAEMKKVDLNKRDTAVSENLFYANEWIKSWFSRLDQNGDKRIDITEFNKETEKFAIEEEYLNVFQKGEANPDGVLSLFEFKNFVDTTDFLASNGVVRQAAPIVDDAYELDPLKLIAGVFAISLLMAAFKYV